MTYAYDMCILTIEIMIGSVTCLISAEQLLIGWCRMPSKEPCG